MNVVMKEVKVMMGGMGVRSLEERGEWRLSDLLHTHDLVLCSELEDDLKMRVERFVKVGKRSLKINADKSRVMVLGRECGWNAIEACVGVHHR